MRDIRKDPKVKTKPAVAAAEEETQESPEEQLQKEQTNPPASDAAAESEAEKAEPERITIEELHRELGTPAPIAKALMVHNRWGTGKKLTRTGYEQALHGMLSKPVCEV